MNLKLSLKMLRKSYLILLAITLSSCARINVNDNQWCHDFGELGAVCYNNLTTNEIELSKDEWDLKRKGMMCTSVESFADLKRTIMQLCRAHKRCVYNEGK